MVHGSSVDESCIDHTWTLGRTLNCSGLDLFLRSYALGFRAFLLSALGRSFSLLDVKGEDCST